MSQDGGSVIFEKKKIMLNFFSFKIMLNLFSQRMKKGTGLVKVGDPTSA